MLYKFRFVFLRDLNPIRYFFFYVRISSKASIYVETLESLGLQGEPASPS